MKVGGFRHYIYYQKKKLTNCNEIPLFVRQENVVIFLGPGQLQSFKKEG